MSDTAYLNPSLTLFFYFSITLGTFCKAVHMVCSKHGVHICILRVVFKHIAYQFMCSIWSVHAGFVFAYIVYTIDL